MHISFLILDCVKPGQIEAIKRGRFGQKSKRILTTFDAQNENANHRLQHSLALTGNRIIFLGNSIYDREGPSISYDDQQHGRTNNYYLCNKNKKHFQMINNIIANIYLNLFIYFTHRRRRFLG
jgi:hypothetical protein